MKHILSSRFSDSTIASASSSFSILSSASSASSVEDLLLPCFDTIPKPPPRTSSITIKSTKTYSERRERRKPAPLQLVSSSTSNRRAEQTYSPSSDDRVDEECHFSCKENQCNSRSYNQPRCFCGYPVRRSTSASTSSTTEIYCSRECARQDALYALEGRSPSSPPPSAPHSDNDEDDDDFPVTPTNAYVPSPPRTPAAKRRFQERQRSPSLMRKLTGLGTTHYRRMEALGLYGADTTPTRPLNSSPLLDPIDLMVAHSPSSNSSRLRSSLASSDHDDEELDFNPRKTLFFRVPFYMGSPFQS